MAKDTNLNSTQRKRGRPRKSVDNAPPNVPVNNDAVQTPPTVGVNSHTRPRTVSDVSCLPLTRARLRESQRLGESQKLNKRIEEMNVLIEQELNGTLSSPPLSSPPLSSRPPSSPPPSSPPPSSPPPSSRPPTPLPTQRTVARYTSNRTSQQPTVTQSTLNSQRQTADAKRPRRRPLPIASVAHLRTPPVSSARYAVRSGPQDISTISSQQRRSREIPPPSPSVTPLEDGNRGHSATPRHALPTAREAVSDARRPPRGSLVPTVFHNRPQPLSPDHSSVSQGASVSTPEDGRRPRKLIRLDKGRDGLRRMDPNIWTKVSIPTSSSIDQISDYSHNTPLSRERNSSYQGRGASHGTSSQGLERKEDLDGFDEEDSMVNGQPRRGLSYTYLRRKERLVFNRTVNLVWQR
ncbi:hypothetical protein DFP73DRAFT_593954 [Morchella snyderi]|nr:hypothetical protein DFP73DRAFT_593954 [Morchella snyderi]